ncbi:MULTISPECIES: molybdopterin-dependent oxidoreductase [Vibrio]|uniref:Molybdopterin-dependent oxidoreductase n=2 Tax=Vibrio TaxID=662 RepID=A0A7X4LJ87_9VIBR|nr:MULTISPECIES: molybdopterin-dependent oxidoreductase [Vibrio]MBF8999940.1 molybdopterin-dependent oxidoreductase [Vibrio nitrifigilis]MZI92846.1 molybdopterin-dependent oxidoreductase [Vibrio eleionomae]
MMFCHSLKRGALFISIIALFIGHAQAQEDTVLTVSGDNQEVSYTMEQLENMAQDTITTETPWTKGNTQFTGITLKKLLEQSGIENENIKVGAINNYWANIPYQDIPTYDPILAFKMNGKSMSVRDKGPLWVIYPLSQTNQLTSELLHSRMVWQVNRIEVLH